ncbi:MAG: hypothetical protein R3B54_06275 [Bdellovibrionota bacterium]
MDDGVDSIESAYVDLPRSLPAGEIRELRYAMMHWRDFLVRTNIEGLKDFKDSEIATLVTKLKSLPSSWNQTSLRRSRHALRKLKTPSPSTLSRTRSRY